jgi:hypothetical protein
MRAQAQLLQFSDLSGSVRERWQVYWADAVTFEGQLWQYMQFDSPQMSDGDLGAERNIGIVMPATTRIMAVVDQALAAGWLAQLRMYEFDSEAGASGPPSGGMTLIAQFDGQAVSARSNLTGITLDLGTALAPVSATAPPRVLTTRLMGVGARL